MTSPLRSIYKKTLKRVKQIKTKVDLFLRNAVKITKKKKISFVKSFRRMKTRVNKKLRDIADIW